MVDLDASDQEVAAIMGGRPQLEASAGAGTMAAGKEACGGDQSGAIGAENSHSGGCKATKAENGPMRLTNWGGVGAQNMRSAL